MASTKPQRVDPPSCGCTDCITGYSVPLDLATWETVKALVHGDVQDATSTELDVMVVVTPADQRTWSDRQSWAWKYDAASIASDHDVQEFRKRTARISAAKYEPPGEVR